MRCHTVLSIWMCMFPIATATLAADPKLDFNRDVRPILSENCFQCHGPDERKRKSGLRLDQKDQVFKAAKSGAIPIVPGNPGQSELIKRVLSSDDDEHMPPKKTLAKEQIEILRRWIQQGAQYKAHWAFLAPERSDIPVPAAKHADWPRNAVDNFVLARLEQHGIEPSPETDRRTLIRRVSLDLTGIPPTPAEVDAFLADKSGDAYEKLVDRLLASPRYGERMAMQWLDGARYADSNGYQADYERFMWRWRDWVIDAYNKNMPFDRFTIEQLAGDLLPNATLEQRIATGFNRNHRINTEGGVIAEEWRTETVIDRVETTSEVWLGLTMGCARCHDHKYDPITQKEFYQFFSFFNNINESGTGEEKPVNHPPFVKAPSAEQQQMLDRLIAANKDSDVRMSAAMPEVDKAQSAWEAAVLKDAPSVPKLDQWYSVGPFHAASFDAAYDTAYEPEKNVDLAKSYQDGQQPLKWVAQPTWEDGKAHDLIGDNCATYLYRVIRSERPVALSLSLGSDDAIKVWLNHAEVLADKVTRGVAPDQEKITINLQAGDNALLMKIVNAGGGYGFYFKALESGVPGTVVAMIKTPADKRSEQQKTELRAYYRTNLAPELKSLRDQIQLSKKQQAELEMQIPTTMVMEELPAPRDAFVLIRGQYDKKGDKVPLGLPAALPPMPKDAPPNRLGLAKWIVDPTNPLTARVAVNRFWERFFGIGIVRTSENFGSQAEWPSHPELLDWMATEFVRLKWDQKAFQKLIVSSATYRQSSKFRFELLEKDPENRLLARGPRFRLQAELIRDQALAMGGLLSEKLGGPSVRPYQPEGVWDDTNVYGNLRNYKNDHDAGLYRRSMYTIWKRTAAPPSMGLFDMPSREICVVKRSRTNTPLQALALLNEVTYVEASRALAQRMIKEGGSSPRERIAFAFRCATARAPNDGEAALLLKGFDERLAKFRNNTEAAKKLIGVGESKSDASLDPVELAAYTTTAAIIMNLDETITRE